MANIVPVHTLAEFWEVDIRTVQNYADPSKEEYPLPRHNGKRGEYDFLEAMKWMYRRQKRELEILKLSGDDELHQHKIINMLIKNEREEIGLKQELAQLVDKRQTINAVSNIMSIVNNQLNSLYYDTLRTLNITEPAQITALTNIYEETKTSLSTMEIKKIITDENSLIEHEEIIETKTSEE